MKKILITLIFLGYLVVTSVSLSANEVNKQRLKEKPPTETSDNPKTPAYSPLYCVFDESMVIIYCDYDAIGSVSLTDIDSGEIIDSTSGMLGQGIMLMLPDNRNDVRIEVEMNGTTYYAII